MGKEGGYLIERWGEHEIRVSDSGMFFAQDEDSRVEAKTLDGLKKKIGGPPVTLKTKAVLFDRYDWEDEGPYQLIDVYGVSALGNFLYTLDGKKEKAGRSDDVRVFDEKKLAEYKRLKQELKRVKADLTDLMEGWAHLERPKETA